jgi:uncharacterized Zn finger protein
MKNNQIVYEIQGSAPDPYIVTVNLEPFTISCTCTAGINGLPCKHRIGVLSGENPGIVKGDISFLPKIAKLVQCTNIFELLKNYDTAKNQKKNAVKRADYAFKNYREARENFALKKVKTDKAIIKCREALETAIDQDIEDEKLVMDTLKALNTVFVRPGR